MIIYEAVKLLFLFSCYITEMSIATEKLSLPRRCRDEFLKNLPLPRRHRHRGSGGGSGSVAMNSSAI
jgi:hypothetical protein